MTLDFKALRAKLNTLQGQNNRSNALWKPAAGENLVRLVPWIKEKSNPFIELYFHYLGNKTYLSPQSFGHPDPIAEFADKLRMTGEREDWMSAKQFTPKLRTYAPMVERGKEAEGVKFWAFGKTVYTELLAVIDDEDYGDIVDPQSGRDILVTFTPKKKGENDGFAKTTIRVKPKEVPLVKDNAKLLEQLLNHQPDIYSLFQEPSYDELKNVLELYLTPGSVTQATKAPETVLDEEGSDNGTPETSEPTATTDETTVAGKVTKQFDELFSK